MAGLIDYNQMVQQLLQQGGGLLGNVAMKNPLQSKMLDPRGGTEGAVGYGGGSNRVFDWTPGGGSKVKKIGNTQITYGVGRDGTAELTHVTTPRAKRGQGSAKNAVDKFLTEADQQGLSVSLIPKGMDASTSTARLQQWYSKLGFSPGPGDMFHRQPKK
jgi:predicted GNAT family acetyltransferase